MGAAEVEDGDPGDDEEDPGDLGEAEGLAEEETPMVATAAVPTPDQMAYAVPTWRVLSACARSAKAIR